ncbi:MAG: hypothetical protein M3Q97_02695 [Bacteroidota bacterium]|nr:hypothetical protein [Bacteroidota bacterium]
MGRGILSTKKVFTEKDLILAESYILQNPWKSNNDFYDFIGKGGTYYKMQGDSFMSGTKEMFFCRINLDKGRMYIICRFLGGKCDIKMEVIDYSPEKIILQRSEDDQPLTYCKHDGPGPSSFDEHASIL